MVETAESVEWTIVRNEVEALMLGIRSLSSIDRGSMFGYVMTRVIRFLR